MLKSVGISEFRTQHQERLLLDACSEGEYAQGHIPGAISFPILNNEERAKVGTCYKQQGHEQAVVMGYELVGPKFSDYLKRAYSEFGGKPLAVQCWRGGLRSQILGNLLETAGFDVVQIRGGYKTYRNLVLDFLSKPMPFRVLGGYTGSAKSEILEEMDRNGFQVLHLEELAAHKGSAFGFLGMPPQPTQEHFENILFEKLVTFDVARPIWVEDESRLIGKIQLPNQIYQSIRESHVVFLDYPFEQRLKHILQWYGKFPKETLAEITSRLRKRMGDLENRKALEFLEEGNLEAWGAQVLRHYDKQYLFGFSQRQQGLSTTETAQVKELLQKLEK